MKKILQDYQNDTSIVKKLEKKQTKTRKKRGKQYHIIFFCLTAFKKICMSKQNILNTDYTF